ncbi:S8 family serine peptidase [Pedobacter sp. MC2016-14]|uniref:S8 family serine peptidase n=1 Tax=Pedobacter sp. MC2016-14 TaxID=2897327 RepID=UPI001E4F2F7F|nr:S8 family serine peptidase [Pedobacter sp. MC2016-14]MCD0490554.1 S8 family serine peptidase [Pedobacter sp. MC2016-14]
MKLKAIYIILLTVLFSSGLTAQDKNVKLPDSWFNLDLIQNGYFGISTEKAYNELLKGRMPKKKVIVAVIDGGVDVNHEDLKDVIWKNNGEIAGNGIDDDKNGYVDDVNGWNFIGSASGTLAYDNLELVRIYKKLLPKYGSTIRSTVLDSAGKVDYALFTRVAAEFGKKYDDADQSYRYLVAINKVMDSVAHANHKNIPSLEDIDKYIPDDEMEEHVKRAIRSGSRKSGGFEKFYKEIKDAYRQYDIMIKYNLNTKYDERAALVGDDYDNSSEKNYGNKDVAGPNADHGSHVSGIIGAVRNNNFGINGVSNHVIVMPVRVVPEGDERDKDVANGIRYAVDNGADIISMSFGKSFSWDKKIVDEAVRYAENKGVLLVHAAGNDNVNVDVEENFPNKYFAGPEANAYKNAIDKSKKAIPLLFPLNGANSGRVSVDRVGKGVDAEALKKTSREIDSLRSLIPYAKNWIEVGASSYKDDLDLKASFSNYGKYNVDVFAPGFMIKSTTAGSKYDVFDGTSMAAPVVSGLAALILSYYPDLKPIQLKDIIMKSVTKVNHKIRYDNEKGVSSRISFSEICVSGGIVNVYNALKLAETLYR